MSEPTESAPSDDTVNLAAQPDDLEVDHEKFMGEVIKDPWDDDDQPDWPNHPPMELDSEEDA